jgi:hypothetical protein
MDDAIIKQIQVAVKEAFSENVSGGRYVDITRVPLLCQAVIGIDKKLDEMVTQDQFWPVKTLVYGLVGIMLTAVVVAVVALVVTTKI